MDAVRLLFSLDAVGVWLCRVHGVDAGVIFFFRPIDFGYRC